MGWSGFQRDAASGVQLVGIDDELLDRYPIADLPYAYEITLTGRAVAPSDTAATELAIRRLAEAAGGHVAATVRGHRRHVTHAYLATSDHRESFAAVPRPRRVSIVVRVEADPTWQRFALVCPRGVERQSMDDFAVLGRLLEAGDNGSSPRPIEHIVSGVPDAASAGFLAAIEQVGVSIDYLPRLSGDRARTALITHDAVPSDVTPIAWAVRDAAERFEGTYRGWDCEIVTADRRPPSTPGRGRGRNDRS